MVLKDSVPGIAKGVVELATTPVVRIAAAVSCSGEELKAAVAMGDPSPRFDGPSPQLQSIAFASVIQVPDALTEVLERLFRQAFRGRTQDVFGLIRTAELLGE